MERQVPTLQEVQAYLTKDRNWGRWGKEDQVGAVNLITPEKRARAARLVRSGRAVSLSRELPQTPGVGNPIPAQHYMKRLAREGGGGAVDYYGLYYHGVTTTHLDALCHTWDGNGMWHGRDPEKEITVDGAAWGAIEHWKEGIVTRGVLLDVPKHRGEPCVTLEKPVHGWELEEIAQKQGAAVEPGDALVVYCGRENWIKTNPPYGSEPRGRPGLHASCLKFIREKDVSLLVWDMLDMMPNGYGIPWTVHAALFAYGVGLLDNALLEPLARACAEEGRHEFMLMVCPLRMVGGTGSPVNPIALF
jgi:kynurenine formamidase